MEFKKFKYKKFTSSNSIKLTGLTTGKYYTVKIVPARQGTSYIAKPECYKDIQFQRKRT